MKIGEKDLDSREPANARSTLSMRRSYRHIIWDWNGTLLDDVDLSIAAMNGVLRRRNLPLLDRARYHTLFDFPVRNYYARLGLDTSDESFRLLSEEFISSYDSRRFDTKLHAGVTTLLSNVTTQGLTQSILSAYRQETLCEVVAHFGIAHHFEKLAGLDNIYAHSKTELGKARLAELALPREEVVLIGDTLHDLEVAGEIGIDCLLVSHGHHPFARLRERHDRVLADIPSVGAALGIAATLE